MVRDYHFISGFPRAGTTLLASILRQNPHFTSHVESPTGRVICDLVQSMSPSNEAHCFLTDDVRVRILRGVFDNIYSDCNAHTVFDNNRRWCANLDLIVDLFPECKVICCVRPIAEIINSFEEVVRAHPQAASIIFENRSNLTVYDRVDYYMRKGAVLSYAMQAVRTAYYGPNADHLLIVRYEDLAKHPGDVMNSIHAELGMHPFNYDFKNIDQIPGTDQFDMFLGTPGLHRLGREVKFTPKPLILPPDIVANCPPSFWDVKETVTKSG